MTGNCITSSNKTRFSLAEVQQRENRLRDELKHEPNALDKLQEAERLLEQIERAQERAEEESLRIDAAVHEARERVREAAREVELIGVKASK